MTKISSLESDKNIHKAPCVDAKEYFHFMKFIQFPYYCEASIIQNTDCLTFSSANSWDPSKASLSVFTKFTVANVRCCII